MKKHYPTACKPDLIRTLTGKAMTTRELADKIGRESETVTKILRDMGEDKAYICAWDKAEAIWTLGNGKHVPRPATDRSKRELECRKKRSKVDYLNTSYITGERIVWSGVPY